MSDQESSHGNSDSNAESERIFTVEEVNALIPKLQIWMSEIVQLRTEMLKVTNSKEESSRGNGRAFAALQDVSNDLAKVTGMAIRIRELVETINETGSEVKDIIQGLVDFRNIRDGRVVYLSWKLDEQEISYWYEQDAGFEGRQLL